jgi:hypothetical protein
MLHDMRREKGKGALQLIMKVSVLDLALEESRIIIRCRVRVITVD